MPNGDLADKINKLMTNSLSSPLLCNRHHPDIRAYVTNSIDSHSDKAYALIAYLGDIDCIFHYFKQLECKFVIDTKASPRICCRDNTGKEMIICCIGFAKRNFLQNVSLLDKLSYFLVKYAFNIMSSFP